MRPELEPKFHMTASFQQSIGQYALFYGRLAWNNNQLDYIIPSNKVVK